MSRIFVSHSSDDNDAAEALRDWLVGQDPPLANEIFLDTDPRTGLKTGLRWKNELISANSRCEAVICLLSKSWESSPECLAEYRTAENMGKQILPARLANGTGRHTSEWQHCDLFAEGLSEEAVVRIGAVTFAKAGLHQLRDAIRGAGIGAENFVWPPPRNRTREPYRGWEPFEEADAGVFFGRDTQIVRALDTLRSMRNTAVDGWFVVLGPSGSGKSSFLRAGLLPRIRRDDHLFAVLDILRPERAALTGDRGFAQAIYRGREGLGLNQPAVGDIEASCANDPAAVRALLMECRETAARRLPRHDREVPLPTLVLPLDQAEELFGPEAGPEAANFLGLIAALAKPDDKGQRLGLIVAATIRTDRYEVMQTAPELTGMTSTMFDDLKPMPDNSFRQVIGGPALRASAGGRQLDIDPDLVDQLLDDGAEGGDALPLLALSLRRLYDKYGSTGRLTLANYESIGGIRKVVQSAVDEVLSRTAAQRAEQLSQLRSAFIPWLATVNPDNDQPMRRVANWSELPPASHDLIAQFVEKRLLVKDQRVVDNSGESQVVVEVALESLLRQWDDLAEWLREEGRQLKNTDDVLRNAAAWEADDRNPDWLLTGTRLADAEALTTEPGYQERLQPARDYMAAARNLQNERAAAEEERRQADLRHAEEQREAAEALAANERAHAVVLGKRSRTLRLVLAATSVIAVVAAIGFVQASYAKHQANARAREAKALHLVSDSQSMLSDLRPGGDERALQQLLAADTIVPSDVVDAAKLDALLDRTALVKIATTTAPALAVAYTPVGNRIAAGLRDKTIGFFDADTGQPTGAHIDAGDEVNALTYTADGRRLVAATHGELRVWDAASGKPLGSQIKDSGYRAVSVSPDGRRMVADTGVNDLAIWDLDDGRKIHDLKGHGESVTSVAYSSDGLRIVSGSEDKTVRLWDAESGQPVGEPLAGHTGGVESVAFSPDGTRVVSGADDDTVRIWDAATGQPVGAPLTGHHDYVRSVAYSPDGGLIVSGSDDRTVRIWDANSGEPVGNPLLGDHDSVTGVRFILDGRRIVSVSTDQTVRIWDGQGRPSLGAPVKTPHRGRSFDLYLSGRQLSELYEQNDLLEQALHRPPNPDRHLPLGDGITANPAFSPDQRRYVTGGQNGTLQAFDTASNEPVGKAFTGHTDWVYAVAYSRDGKRLVSGSADKTIRMWDADTGTPTGSPLTGHTKAVLGVAFSPDGHRIASASNDHTIRVWDADTGQQIGQPMNHAQAVEAVAFSPDGRFVASGSDDKTVRLWDAATGQPVGAPMTGAAGWVTTVAFSPDGREIVSGSLDNTVRLWETETTLPLGKPLTGHRNTVKRVDFRDDGHIVSDDEDEITRIWPGPSIWHGLVCTMLTTNMSRRDWGQWVLPDIDYVQACPNLPVPN